MATPIIRKYFKNLTPPTFSAKIAFIHSLTFSVLLIIFIKNLQHNGPTKAFEKTFIIQTETMHIVKTWLVFTSLALLLIGDILIVTYNVTPWSRILLHWTVILLMVATALFEILLVTLAPQRKIILACGFIVCDGIVFGKCVKQF